jgi:uncharacterized membrane protein YesL
MISRFPASLRVIGRSFVDWWDSWVDLVMMMLIWVLCVVTVVLAAPATFGMYYVIHEMQNGTSLGLRGMVDGARRYFWKAMLWGVFFVLSLVLMYVNYIFYGSIDATWAFGVQILVLLIFALWMAANFYGLPYFMIMEKPSLRTALKNGALTSLAAPFFTLVIMLFVAVLLVLSFGFVIPVFLGIPALVPILGFRAIHDRLEAFGLREREKTPKEIEAEQAAATKVSGLNWIPGQGATGSSIPKHEGQVEQEE